MLSLHQAFFYEYTTPLSYNWLMLHWHFESSATHLSRSLGWITTLALSPSAKAYMYSMKMSFLAKWSRISESEPATLGQLIHTTSVNITAKFSLRNTSTARSTSDTINRKIPKSVVSAILNACILMPYLPNIFVRSLMRPVLFSRKIDSCLIVIISCVLMVRDYVYLSHVCSCLDCVRCYLAPSSAHRH